MKTLFYVVAAACLTSIVSCGNTDAQHTVKTSGTNSVMSIKHYNVIMAPDLSNRLTKYKKPVTDNAIIDSVLAAIYPGIATHLRKMNQMDKYRLDIINPQQVVAYNVQPKNLFIDLSQFEHQGERIAYLGPGQANSKFMQDKVSFSKEFAQLTNTINANTAGSDIWTYLNEGLDNFKIDTTTRITTFGKDVYRNEYRNVLLLFTDGYLESTNTFTSGKKSRNLSQSMVEAFRNDFNLNSKGRDLETFFKESGYGIVPVSNPIIENLDVLVLELYDRSASISGATKSPTDLEIMKLFWMDWFKQSGVRKYDFLPITPTAAAARDRILRFMEIQKK